MLLRKISLKGFLSYYGRKNENGQVKPVEIDLSAAPLWLIYGPNGSGKSAIFDAITFALFKLHRGGKSSFYRLINDASERAEIILEVELNGQHYLIQRTISRTKRSANVWGIVRYWNGEGTPASNEYDNDKNWPALPNTTNNVEEWVEKNLRMSPDTFTSAVVLRQGEADAFLKAKPASRKKRLLELLDLQFYEKLGQAANRKKSDWDKKLKKRQERLNTTEKVTKEDLSAQEKFISDNLEPKLATAKKVLENKATELKNTKSYENLSDEIEQKEKRQRDDDRLMQRAEIILANVSRYRELDKVLVVLDSLWSARNRVSAEDEKIKEKSEAIEKSQTDQAELTPQLEKARKDEEAANEILEVKNGELTQALEQQRILKGKLEQLEQVEKLEQQISEAEAKLRPYKKILGEADDIERKHQRYELLRDTILPVLRPLKDAEKYLQEMQAKFKTAENILKEWTQKIKQAKGEEKVVEKDLEAKSSVYDGVNKALIDIQGHISLLRQNLDNRESVSDKPECPICGSHLDDEETQARLANERSHWQREIEELEDRRLQLEEKLKLKEQAKRVAEDELKNTQGTIRRLENELAGYQRDVEHSARNLRQAEQTLDEAKQNAGDWVEQLTELDSFEAEFVSLKREIPQNMKNLQEARRVESAASATTETCQKQLVDLPQWSTDERQQLKADCEEIDQKVSACQHSKTHAENDAKEKKSECEGLEEQQRKLENALTLAENDLKNLRQNKQQAEEEVEQQQQKLPSTWIGHPVCREETALDKLRKEFEGLEGAEDEESQLQQAQQRVTELAGAIETLRTQLETIPLQHRRPVADVQAEWNTADEDVKRCEAVLGEEQVKLGKMREQKKTYKERLTERDEAAKELSYNQRLAKIFGRKGLQAQIIQKAQETVKTNANLTLGRLSNGVWQVELQEDAKGEELEILARDTSQPGMPLRPFEYISGGERFRVAISLAVAIGQSISGGRTVDTLVIDEGFGSLDEVNRDMLVDELQRLSRDVLQGGRVVVVSHQEDVCEKFGNRYHVSKHGDGQAQVQQYPKLTVN